MKQVKLILAIDVPNDFDKRDKFELDKFLSETIGNAGYFLESSEENNETQKEVKKWKNQV